jgi:pSer/pThr/pTyr-binding forkhead associated (FHA) protein
VTGWILRQMRDESPITFRLAPGTVKTVGRTTHADFILDAALVSRLHCRLTAAPDSQLMVEDLGSTNGTIVNGQKVDRQTLSHGDRLTIGRVDFEVVWYDPKAS